LLRRRFGERFVPDEARPVDKRALFTAMCADDALRREVEHLVHPLVRAEILRFWERASRAFAADKLSSPLAVAEVPLYLEAGWRGAKPPETLPPSIPAPLLAGVYCPHGQRMRRLRGRGWDEKTIAIMESWQWAEGRKIRSCDLVVDNSGSLEDLKHAGRVLVRLLVWLDRRRGERILEALRALY
jgi:23S rRNA pseudouridine1911/1915/1917 synthase